MPRLVGTSSSIESRAAPRRPPRYLFIDRLRLAAVLSVVFLHVVLTNPPGESTPYRRLASLLCSIFSNETLIFVSMFLALSDFRSERWASFYRARLFRIGIPFLCLSILYVAMDALWQRSGIFFRFSLPEATVLAITTGLAEYHLHFLPTLLTLFLFLPLFARDAKLPAILLMICVGSLLRTAIQYMVLRDSDLSALTTTQLLLLHLAKVIAYFPFGFLARWFVGRLLQQPAAHAGSMIAKRGIPVFMASIVAVDLLLDGVLGTEPSAFQLGIVLHDLISSTLITSGIFLLSGAFSRPSDDGKPSDLLTTMSSHAFLVLMIHPAFLKLFRLLVPRYDGTLIADILCVGCVLSASLAVAMGTKWASRQIWPDGSTNRRAFS